MGRWTRATCVRARRVRRCRSTGVAAHTIARFTRRWSAPSSRRRLTRRRIDDGSGRSDARVANTARLADFTSPRGWQSIEWAGEGPVMKSTLLVLNVVGATVAAAGTWRVGPGDVRVICPMTIGGTFDARTTALSGALTARGSGSAALDGSLAVDLRTLDTGINLRGEGILHLPWRRRQGYRHGRSGLRGHALSTVM